MVIDWVGYLQSILRQSQEHPEQLVVPGPSYYAH